MQGALVIFAALIAELFVCNDKFISLKSHKKQEAFLGPIDT